LSTQTGNEEKILNVEDKEDTDSTENINEVLRRRFQKSESKDYYEWLENEAKHDPVVKQHLLTTNVLLVTEEGALIGQSPSPKPSKAESSSSSLSDGVVQILFTLFLIAVGLPFFFLLGFLIPSLFLIVIISAILLSLTIIPKLSAPEDDYMSGKEIYVILFLLLILFCVYFFYKGSTFEMCFFYCEE